MKFAQKLYPEMFRFAPVSNYEGQILVKAEYAGLSQHFDALASGHRIKELLEKEGCVVAFELGMVKASVAAYRAEFSDVNTTEKALSHLNGLSFAVRFPTKPGTCRWLTHADVYLEHRSLPT